MNFLLLGLALLLIPRVVAANLPLPPGFYQGYDPETGTHLRLQLRGNGGFSAKLTTPGASAAMKGRVDGAPVGTSKLPGLPVLVVTSNPDSSLTGRLDHSGQIGKPFPVARGFSGRGASRAPLAGTRINANLTGSTILPGGVAGAGFFTTVPRPNGSLRVLGRLPDNSALTFALRASVGDVAGSARAPFAVALGRKAQRQGFTGEWELRRPAKPQGNEVLLTGDARWIRPDGETTGLRAAGGRWPRTITGRNVLGNGIDYQRFILHRLWEGRTEREQGLMDPHPHNRPNAEQPVAAAAEKLVLQVDPRTGIFEGSFEETAPDGSKMRRRLAGALTGYFLDEYTVLTAMEDTETVTLYGRGLIDLGERRSGLVEIIKPPPGPLLESIGN